jgi:hypothetical protein
MSPVSLQSSQAVQQGRRKYAVHRCAAREEGDPRTRADAKGRISFRDPA